MNQIDTATAAIRNILAPLTASEAVGILTTILASPVSAPVIAPKAKAATAKIKTSPGTVGRPATVQPLIVDMLREKPMRAADVARAIKRGPTQVHAVIRKLAARGQVRRLETGEWTAAA